MALSITGQRQPKPKVSRVAACSVAPVVPVAEVTSAASLVNQIELSGKQRGALIVIKAAKGDLSFALGSGDLPTDTWQPFTMDAAITPATIAALAFSTNLPATKSVATGAALALTVAVTGGIKPYNYAWSQDGKTRGTNAASFNVTAAAASDAGKYKCVVTDAAGKTITSAECMVTATA